MAGSSESSRCTLTLCYLQSQPKQRTARSERLNLREDDSVQILVSQRADARVAPDLRVDPAETALLVARATAILFSGLRLRALGSGRIWNLSLSSRPVFARDTAAWTSLPGSSTHLTGLRCRWPGGQYRITACRSTSLL